MTCRWSDFVKTAVEIPYPGSMFVLKPGETPQDAVSLWNKNNPHKKVSLTSIGPGERSLGGKYLPGVRYPLFPAKAAPPLDKGKQERLTHDLWRSHVLPGAPDGLTVQSFGKKVMSLSPRVARRNTYHLAALRKYGPSYDRDKANALADKDYEAALENRWKELIRRGLTKEPFDKTKNYIIHPTGTYTPATPIQYGKSVDFGRIDDKIPIFRDSNTDGRGATSWGWWGDQNKITRVNAGPLSALSDRLFYTIMHEGDHTVTPIYRGIKEAPPPPNWPKGKKYYDKGKESIWEGLDDEAKKTSSGVSGYAASPWEALPGILEEKAEMRTDGDDGSPGMGKRWAVKMLRARAKNPDMVKTYNAEEAVTNKTSLRHIFFDLWDKANSKGASKEDQKKMWDFINNLDYYFNLAENKRRGASPGGGRAIA